MAETSWKCVLELDSDRNVADGSFRSLYDVIRRAGDLRVYTEFRFEEHIVPGGDGDLQHDGLMREVIDFVKHC